ncbi:MAG TPA: hypothetical protein VF195_12430 [Actinomycetota bacterium]
MASRKAMQAEGDVIRFPERAAVPVDFSTFFAEVDDTIRVWIVDVGGTRLFLEAITTEDATDGLFREVKQIIESIRFG